MQTGLDEAPQGGMAVFNSCAINAKLFHVEEDAALPLMSKQVPALGRRLRPEAVPHAWAELHNGSKDIWLLNPQKH